MKKKTSVGLKIISINRKASFNYFFESVYEAGIVLTEFRLDGSIKKPSISFRPLSSAPGLLRDIFNLFRSDLTTPKENNIQN